jgi:hypothetical protein
MRTVLSISLVFLFLFSTLQAQVDSVYTGRLPDSSSRPPKKLISQEIKERITWGGNFQAWIGNPTFIFLSPTVGYIPFRNFNVGVGGIYNYTSYRTWYGTYAQSIFGGHSYARYVFAESYFVQLQFDKLRQPDFFASDPNARRWVNYLMLGLGLRQSIGERTSLITSIMYNLIPDPLSIYPSRVIVQFGVVGTF